jgi:uncharacterized protein YhaN
MGESYIKIESEKLERMIVNYWEEKRKSLKEYEDERKSEFLNSRSLLIGPKKTEKQFKKTGIRAVPDDWEGLMKQYRRTSNGWVSKSLLSMCGMADFVYLSSEHVKLLGLKNE